MFCYRKGVVDLNAEISNGTLDLSMPQKELYGSQVAGSAIDQCRLGSTQGMRSEFALVETDPADPLGYEASILSRAKGPSEFRPRGNRRSGRSVTYFFRPVVRRRKRVSNVATIAVVDTGVAGANSS